MGTTRLSSSPAIKKSPSIRGPYFSIISDSPRSFQSLNGTKGGIGTWYDAMIPGNWPIPLNEITTKVYLWHGEEDISAPLSMGRYLAEKIPNCEAKFIKGAGHFWIFEHVPEMLEKLMK